MYNEGYLCYFNAALQILVNHSAVLDLLLEEDHIVQCSSMNCLWCKLADFAQAYHCEPANTLFLSRQGFWRAVCDRGWAKRGAGLQQDAVEFYTWLVQSIMDDLDGFYSTEDGNRQDSHAEAWCALFGINTVKYRTCSGCRSTENARSEPNNWTHIIGIGKCRSLQALLHTSLRTGGDAWQCSTCQHQNKGGPTTWSNFIRDPPEILLIQPGRFCGKTAPHYDNTHISLDRDEIIDITPLLDDARAATKRRICYELSGVVMHLGNTVKGGHYISLVRVGDVWYECNDNEILTADMKDWGGMECKPGYSATLFILRRHEACIDDNSTSELHLLDDETLTTPICKIHLEDKHGATITNYSEHSTQTGSEVKSARMTNAVSETDSRTSYSTAVQPQSQTVRFSGPALLDGETSNRPVAVDILLPREMSMGDESVIVVKLLAEHGGETYILMASGSMLRMRSSDAEVYKLDPERCNKHIRKIFKQKRDWYSMILQEKNLGNHGEVDFYRRQILRAHEKLTRFTKGKNEQVAALQAEVRRLKRVAQSRPGAEGVSKKQDGL